MPDKILGTRAENTGRRLQEVGVGEYAEEVYTRSAWDSAIATGRAFVATSERLTTTLTNTHIIGHVVNTSADKVVTIQKIVSNQAPNAMVVGDTMLNPTAGVPAPNIDPFGMRALLGGQETPAFTVGIGVASAAPTGGTAVTFRTTTHQGRTDLPLGLPIGPGQSVALYIPLGLVAAGDGTFAVYITQETAV